MPPGKNALLLLVFLIMSIFPGPSAPPFELHLHSSPCSEAEQVEERSRAPGLTDRAITNVSTSTLTITWPEHLGPGRTAPAILVCPGGGYGKLAIDKEGHDIARWLNKHGCVAAVLKYRLPRRDRPADPPWPIEDALTAMETLRSRAGEWRIREDAIGIMGSSAGGHLASTIATKKPEHGTSSRSRPDFQILLYPVITFEDGPLLNQGSRRNLLGPSPDPALFPFYSSEKRVTATTPPAFLVHARDDRSVPVENSRLYQAALEKAGVPCRLVELPSGGHGFGLGVNGGDPLTWPPLCLEWLQSRTGGAP